MSTVDQLANINTELDTQYLEAYQSNVGNLYSTLQGLYASLKALNGYRSDNFNISVKVIADPTAKGIYTKVVQKSVRGTFDQNNVNLFVSMEIQIICPYCPQGNFSQPVLQKAYDYVLNNTNFNWSDLGNHTGDYNFSDIVSINTGLVQIPAIPSISLPLDINVPNIGIPLFWFVGFDTLLTIYRWYKTAGIAYIKAILRVFFLYFFLGKKLANVIRGKDVEIELRHLMVRSKSVFCCPSNENIGDKVLSSVIYCSGYCSNVTYTCWKLFYWIWLLVQLLILLSFLLLMYFLIDQIINVNFIKQLQIFPLLIKKYKTNILTLKKKLLTSGLAAQRSVRNSVICTTALTYNNYTLANMKKSRIQYAIEKNAQIVQWNKGELQRVEGFNSYFCDAWGQYMGTVRGTLFLFLFYVTQDGYPVTYVGSSNLGTVAKQTLPNLFDHLTNTSWQPYIPSDSKTLRQDNKHRTVSIDIEFPRLQLMWAPHPNFSTYWHIEYVAFSWNFNKSNSQGYNSSYGSVPYTFYIKSNGSDTYEAQSTSSNKYMASDYQKTNDVQTVYVYNSPNDTKFLRINFSSAETWADAFQLNEITVYGKVASHNVKCPTTIYSPIIFDASDSAYNPKLCPGVQPIFGVMYRHFVRSWLDDALWDAHVPFIIAVRAICLSPFYILVIAVGGLICGYLVAFMIEWVLSSVDLLRENPYAPVPLVYSRHPYDKSRHEPRAFKDATIAHDYYRPDLKDMLANEEDKQATSMSHMLHADEKVETNAHGGYTNVELQPKNQTVQRNIETVSESPRQQMQPVETVAAEEAQPRAFGLPPRVPPKPPRKQSAEIDYPMDDMPENG
ncbi:hypothetical protein RFI_10687 [Reticulomyxa filosa]|uniref:Uncharacterized protein n=1 Tax=Reticulomyxa filosa TaxID=46433 RepID=X6NKM5_RETFI|nr:hypothetical protein RFI_10687 [Reticulomyxa filosa]|eukprot:ETO26453.1 hypothetical protein RFI_10687 [Reticulomyxa filosa]